MIDSRYIDRVNANLKSYDFMAEVAIDIRCKSMFYQLQFARKEIINLSQALKMKITIPEGSLLIHDYKTAKREFNETKNQCKRSHS